MLQIQNALGILSSQVPTGNLLWVDQINGVDALATRGRLTIPFKTLTAAKNAAKSGDTIMVLPGTYDESDLLKNGVNWYFFPGAKIDSTSENSVFATGTNAITSLIGGHGEFLADGAVLYSSGAGSNLTVQALRMESRDASCIVCGAASGRVQVMVLDSIKATSGVAIEVNGDAEDNSIEARLVESGGYSLSGSAGGAYLKANKISSSGNPINIWGGTAFVVDAFEITGGSGNYAVNHASSATLLIRGARLQTTNQNTVHAGAGTSDKIRLSGCLLLASSGHLTLNAANASTNVHILGGTVGNRDKGSNVVVIPGSWQFNTSLS